METFEQRLITEENQLDEKINKLEKFTSTEAYRHIDTVQQTLLSIQLQAMKTYQKCLTERIMWFKTFNNIH